jgi:hypothetical protein
MVSDVKNNGMIPIVQIPIGTKSHELDITVDVIPYARQLIDQLNQNGPNSAEFTLYWIIGNEPDIDAEDPSHHFDRLGFTIAQTYSKTMTVMNDMVSYQSSMYPNNPPLKFIGPELSYYRDHAESNTQNCPNCSSDYGFMITNLTSGSFNLVSGNTNNLDYFSFHYYATADQGHYNAETIKPDRVSLIKTLRNSVPNWGATGNVTPLATNLNSLNSLLFSSGAKIAITEANICTGNAVPGSTQTVTDDSESENGANSFLAGQHYTELAGLCMEKGVEILNYWSMREGTATPFDEPTRPWKSNIGMYDSNTSSWYYSTPYGPNNNGIKQSWWHLWAMAENPASLKGIYVPGINVTVNGGLGYDFKAFGSTICGRYAVVLINQTGSDKSVKINLGSTPVAISSADVVGYMDMGANDVVGVFVDLNTSYYDYDGEPQHAKTDKIRKDETVILVFDKCGNIVKTSRVHMGEPMTGGYFGPSTSASCNCE